MITPRPILPRCLAAVVVLAACLLPSCRGQGNAHSLQAEPKQEEPDSGWITVSGTAVLPDGSPAANLPVELKEPLDVFVHPARPIEPPPENFELPEFKYKLLGAGTTDAAGHFSIRFQHKNVFKFQLDVGEKAESAWTKKPLTNDGKDIDVGELRLRKKGSFSVVTVDGTQGGGRFEGWGGGSMAGGAAGGSDECGVMSDECRRVVHPAP